MSFGITSSTRLYKNKVQTSEVATHSGGIKTYRRDFRATTEQVSLEKISEMAADELADYLGTTKEELGIDIQIVDYRSPKFNKIVEAVEGTDVTESLRVHSVLRIRRKNSSEEKEFLHFSRSLKKDNIKHLWHGSEARKFASILKQGLKVGNGENGDLYGKGIYFADSVSKSLNYCDQGTEYVLMVFCAVALGKSVDHSSVALKSDSIIVKGSLKPTFVNGPNGSEHAIALRRKHVGADIYNEYIVPSPRHVLMRYLVILKRT